MKIRPVGAELVHADGRTEGRTDTTKLLVAFRNLANAPETQSVNAAYRKKLLYAVRTIQTRTYIRWTGRRILDGKPSGL
jgi:hypothetical protein